MAKLLDVVDIVNAIQTSLSDKSIVAAYFSREHVYEYYFFENIKILIDFLKEKEAGDFSINKKDPYIIDFSCDEWLVFSDKKKATEVLLQILTVWKEDDIPDGNQ